MTTRFPDGDEIAIDPRDADPVIYYLPQGDWQRALGIELDPPYDAEQRRAVTVRLWGPHTDRFGALENPVLQETLERIVRFLSGHYSRWRRLTLDLPSWLTSRLGPEVLDGQLATLGWRRDTTVGRVWTR